MLVAGLVASTVGLGAAALGGAVAGAPAAVGALVGLAIVLAFFGLGAMVLDLVATIAPALSLLIALLTYTLQVVAVGLVFVALSRSGLLDTQLDARWLGGTVIAATVAWLVGQLVAHVRSRQPLYDLPTSGPGSAGGSDEASDGGSGGASRPKEAAAR